MRIRNLLVGLLFLVIVSIPVANRAQTACTMSFEQYLGPSQSPFSGTTIHQGLLTVSGGAIAYNPLFNYWDPSPGMYLTTDTDSNAYIYADLGSSSSIGLACTNCSQKLNIVFSQPVSNFSFSLYNGKISFGFFTIFDVSVNSSPVTLYMDGNVDFPPPGYDQGTYLTYPFPPLFSTGSQPTSNIQQVTITPTCDYYPGLCNSDNGNTRWDFAIDDIHYTRPDNLSCDFDSTESAPDLGPCGPRHCNGQAGSPVNLGNGNVWIEEKDFSIPGLGGGLALDRVWNSQWQDSSPLTLAGMFGNSWRSTYEERLTFPSFDTAEYWRGTGQAWAFSYNSALQTYSLGTPPDERAALQFNTGTNQFILTLADGSQRIFNQAGYLVAMVDRNGNQTTLTYDGSNRLIQVADAGGQSISFTYGDANNPDQATSVQDSTGTLATYSYDSSQRLTQVAYPDGSVMNFAYDASSMITSITDGQGKLLESHTYDSSHRGLSSQRADGADSVTVSYPGAGQAVLTDSKGNSTTYTSENVDGRSFIDSIVGPGCASCGGRGDSSSTYDSQGNRLSSTDALGRVTDFTYDSMGNVLTKTVHLDANTPLTSSYTYNSFQEVLTATDPMGNTTTNSYDPHGNLLSTTTPPPSGSGSGFTTSFSYDSKGELTRVTDPNRDKTALTYSSAGLVASIKDPQRNTTSFQYDARGNRTSTTDAAGNTTSFTYDNMSRLTRITYPDGSFTSFGYDYRGRRTSVTDANNKITQYQYDDADRLTQVTDAANNMTGYQYDTENNLTSITDAMGRVTTFGYDSMGRVTSTTFPSTLSETYTYDAMGNLLSRTDRKGQTITYAYDNLDRLTSKTYPSSGGVSYTYDADSRLTQVTDPTGTYSFTYDNMGQLTGTATTYSFLSGRTLTESYSYDSASNRASFTGPEGGTTSYGYDSDNRLTSLASATSGSFSFSYDSLSRRTQLSRPNGINANYTYDSLSRLLSVLDQTRKATLDGAAYTYDPAGNRLSRQDYQTGIMSNFAYDAIYQLLQVAQSGQPTETYSYDNVGNRLSSLGVSPYSYDNSNELNSQPGVTYSYDANGNLTSKTDANGTTSYTWDVENRLASVALPAGGRTVTYQYDPFGRRIEKISPTGTTIYAYDGDNVVEELDGGGTAVARYTQGLGIDEPLAMYRGGASYYYDADGLGSITSLTDASGQIAATYTYDSFGKLTASTGTVTNPFRYTGREFDSAAGLYYYRARYYDPQIARFLSEDPVAFQGGINFYAYVYDNPANLVDPSGKGPCLDIQKFIDALDHNALPPYGKSRCGEYVGKALKQGRIDLESSPGHYHNGKDYGPYLRDSGFSEVSAKGYQPQAGDVAVFQPYPGGHSGGHVQGFDGSNWVSDFVQPYPATAPGGIYPGKGYRANKASYRIYRPNPCPTSPAEQGLFQQLANWFSGLFQ